MGSSISPSNSLDFSNIDFINSDKTEGEFLIKIHEWIDNGGGVTFPDQDELIKCRVWSWRASGVHLHESVIITPRNRNYDGLGVELVTISKKKEFFLRAFRAKRTRNLRRKATKKDILIEDKKKKWKYFGQSKIIISNICNIAKQIISAFESYHLISKNCQIFARNLISEILREDITHKHMTTVETIRKEVTDIMRSVAAAATGEVIGIVAVASCADAAELTVLSTGLNVLAGAACNGYLNLIEHQRKYIENVEKLNYERGLTLNVILCCEYLVTGYVRWCSSSTDLTSGLSGDILYVIVSLLYDKEFIKNKIDSDLKNIEISPESNCVKRIKNIDGEIYTMHGGQTVTKNQTRIWTFQLKSCENKKPYILIGVIGENKKKQHTSRFDLDLSNGKILINNQATSYLCSGFDGIISEDIDDLITMELNLVEGTLSYVVDCILKPTVAFKDMDIHATYRMVIGMYTKDSISFTSTGIQIDQP